VGMPEKHETITPLPESSKDKYNLKTLEVGESMSVPLADGIRLRAAAQYRRQVSNWRYVSKKVGDEVWVWRTEDAEVSP